MAEIVSTVNRGVGGLIRIGKGIAVSGEQGVYLTSAEMMAMEDSDLFGDTPEAVLIFAEEGAFIRLGIRQPEEPGLKADILLNKGATRRLRGWLHYLPAVALTLQNTVQFQRIGDSPMIWIQSDPVKTNLPTEGSDMYRISGDSIREAIRTLDYLLES